MLKTKVTYVDFNGEPTTDEIYLHLSRMEMMKFLARYGITDIDSVKEAFTNLTNQLVDKKDAKGLLEIIDDFLLSSYGVRSDDGKRFIKNDKVRTDFDQSLAHEALLDKFLSDKNFLQSSVANIMQTNSVPASNQAGPHLKSHKAPADFKRAKNRQRNNRPQEGSGVKNN